MKSKPGFTFMPAYFAAKPNSHPYNPDQTITTHKYPFGGPGGNRTRVRNALL